MIIVCPRCGILYSVDPAVLADDARTVRCSNCDCEWLHTRNSALPDSDEALRLLAMSVAGESAPKRRPSVSSPPAQPVPATGGQRAPTPAATAERMVPADKAEAAVAAFAGDVRPSTEEAPAAPDEAPDEGPPAPAARQAARLHPEQEDQASVDDSEHAGAEDSVDERMPAPPSPAFDPDDRETRRSVQPGITPTAFAPAPDTSDVPSDASIPPVPLTEAEQAHAQRTAPAGAVRLPRTALLVAGAVAATLLISVGLLAAVRGPVIAAFPGAAGFYSAVGLGKSDDFAEGLEIRGVSSTRSWNDGAQVLTVAGALANTAKKPRILPMVRVVLVDGSDTEVQEVVVVPPGETLPVGETVRFEAQISDPADTAERIKVSLAPRPESS